MASARKSTDIATLGWLDDGPLADIVREQSDENLRVYATSATRVDEDAGQEMNLTHGGYGKRQLLELIQNGADALLSTPNGHIRVVLTHDYLYCANEGDPIDEDGIKALLHAHISRKRDAEIGRFGLGFKSVLGVSSRPEFFCRAVSFGFDAEWSAREIARVAPDRERYPALRVARLLDPRDAAASDEILRDLMAQATSVVRLKRDVSASDWLRDDIRDFDSAFMLFSPHVAQLSLEDRTTETLRHIRLASNGTEVTIAEEEETRRWRVFKSTIKPSDEAKREAWELSAREQLPVVWAVPVEGRLAVGKFWAFFPLRDATTLTGIANAPWQINDDRTGLLEGSRLNQELLDELTELVLRSIPAIVKDDDPGWVLDVIPARGREWRCWGDDYLTKQFYEEAVDWPLIPDQSGQLRRASELHLAPGDASREALQLWSSLHCPIDWCDTSAIATTTRRSRVDRLFEAAGKSEESVSTWLEAVLADGATVEASAGALLAAASYIGDDSGPVAARRQAVHRSRIVLDANSDLVEAKPADVFIPRSDTHQSSLVRLVHPFVAQVDGVAEALGVIGIEELTPILELKTYLRLGLRKGTDEEWEGLWALVREIEDAAEAAAVLQSGSRNRALHVRTLTGRWRPLAETLLPGAVVPSDGSRDADVAVDLSIHERELEVLRSLGLADKPMDGFPTASDSVVDAYLRVCVRTYLDELPPGGSKPAWDYLEFDRKTHVGPLAPLAHLSDEGRAAFVDQLLNSTTDWRPWTLKHATKREYPTREFPPAASWAAETYGRVHTSRGVVPPTLAWGPAFEQWAEVVPVARIPEDAMPYVGVANELRALTPERWAAALEVIAESTDDSLIGEFYDFAACARISAPSELRCRIGNSHGLGRPGDVSVTANQNAFNALRDLGEPCVRVRDEIAAARLIRSWGLVAPTAHVRQETQWIESGPATPLGDVFPTLREDLEDAGLAEYELVPCDEIVETVTTEAGTREIEKEFELHGTQILWRADLGLEQTLRQLRQQLPLEIDDQEIEALAEGRWQQERREKLAAIRELKTAEERLLAAVGEERLRVRLPVGLVDAVADIHGPLSPLDLARLAMVVYGDDVLSQLR